MYIILYEHSRNEFIACQSYNAISVKCNKTLFTFLHETYSTQLIGESVSHDKHSTWFPHATVRIFAT